MQTKLPLAELIESRLRQLGLTPQGLGFRLGYSNPAKAAGRVYALREGYLDNRKSKAALVRLADALELPADQVEQIIELTRESLAEQKQIENEELERANQAKEMSWRIGFKPHAVILTEKRMPSQVTFCGLAGGPESLLTIPFDLAQSPITFIQQALARLPMKAPVAADGRRYVRFFGEAFGFIINYSPDRALHCDLEGNPIKWLSAACRVGQIEVLLNSRIKSPRTVTHLFGMQEGKD